MRVTIPIVKAFALNAFINNCGFSKGAGVFMPASLCLISSQKKIY
jgi:hypothetical protein